MPESHFRTWLQLIPFAHTEYAEFTVPQELLRAKLNMKVGFVSSVTPKYNDPFTHSDGFSDAISNRLSVKFQTPAGKLTRFKTSPGGILSSIT